MAFYVYVIKSLQDNSLYKGITENYYKRIEDHNEGLSTYTSRKTPWQLIYLEVYEIKREGLIREKVLKKYSRDQIKKLIDSPKNRYRHLVDEWLKSLPNQVGD